jgi:hypothetical protein
VAIFATARSVKILVGPPFSSVPQFPRHKTG